MHWLLAIDWFLVFLFFWKTEWQQRFRDWKRGQQWRKASFNSNDTLMLLWGKECHKKEINHRRKACREPQSNLPHNLPEAKERCLIENVVTSFGDLKKCSQKTSEKMQVIKNYSFSNKGERTHLFAHFKSIKLKNVGFLYIKNKVT